MMKIDDSLFRSALGELILDAASSEKVEWEIDRFLERVENESLVRYAQKTDPASGETVILVEPSNTLLEFLACLRDRRNKLAAEHS